MGATPPEGTGEPMNLLEAQSLAVPEPRHHASTFGAKIYREIALLFHLGRLTKRREDAETPSNGAKRVK